MAAPAAVVVAAVVAAVAAAVVTVRSAVVNIPAGIGQIQFLQRTLGAIIWHRGCRLVR